MNFNKGKIGGQEQANVDVVSHNDFSSSLQCFGTECRPHVQTDHLLQNSPLADINEKWI